MKRLALSFAFALCFTGIGDAQNTFPASGNVGIGITSPNAPLTVYNSNGTTKIFGPNLELNNFSAEYNLLVAAGNFHLQNNSDAGAPIRFTVQGGSGNVGIGTTSPSAKLDIYEVNPTPLLRLSSGWPENLYSLVTRSFIAAPGVVSYAMDVKNNNIDYPSMLTFSGNGKLGMGTDDPAEKLDVVGNIKISGTGAHLVMPDGTVQSTAWNGTTCGGDYAESVDVIGDRKSYEPGDVLVIDRASPDKFVHSLQPYSRLVAGIYSTKPGLTGRRQGLALTGEEVPMAMLGIVPTKVSAENGAIEVGDLLVSSATEGYAMKGTDESKMMGAVIGKAMSKLDSGKGVIEVLVSLQ